MTLTRASTTRTAKGDYEITGIIPVGRVGTAEHVAAAVLYLFSDDAKFTVERHSLSMEASSPGKPQASIGPAAVFLASDNSKWITGETLLISGSLR